MKIVKNVLVVGFVCTSLFSNMVNAASDVGSSSSWEGQYVGLSIGSALGTAEPSAKVRDTDYFVGTDEGQVNPQASKKLDASNVNGSLYWGLNRQSGNIVYGIEADVSLGSFNEKHTSPNIEYLTSPGTTFTVTTKVKSDWAISLRPRIGFVQTGSLFYVSAGPVIRNFDYDFSFSDTAFNEATSVNRSETKVGLAASLGYERQLKGGWILKAEYAYSTFNEVIKTSSRLINYTDGLDHKLDFNENVLRIGLSKRF